VTWRKRSIQEILAETKSLWDVESTPLYVREAFRRVIACRTGSLGYSWRQLPNGKWIRRANSCKSRVCPSCGWRATLEWVRSLKANLPDGVYQGISFSMPDVLWDVFWNNRELLKDVPTLGAQVVSSWVQKRFSCEVPIISVGHNFGAHLNFNTHCHLLVTTFGLNCDDFTLRKNLYFPKSILVPTWRDAVLDYLKAALRKGMRVQSAHVYDVGHYLETQTDAFWNGESTPLPKSILFAKYIARYLRRPPISERRILPSDSRHVRFCTYDKMLKKDVTETLLVEDFLSLLIQQVHGTYEHGVRYFGLLAPRRACEYDLLWSLLRQPRPEKPLRMTFAEVLSQIPEHQRLLK
jgi:hypothetical protein